MVKNSMYTAYSAPTVIMTCTIWNPGHDPALTLTSCFICTLFCILASSLHPLSQTWHPITFSSHAASSVHFGILCASISHHVASSLPPCIWLHPWSILEASSASSLHQISLQFASYILLASLGHPLCIQFWDAILTRAVLLLSRMSLAEG